jgi:hypothetical protein
VVFHHHGTGDPFAPGYAVSSTNGLQFDAVRVCARESVVVECIEVDDPCRFEVGHPVAVVALPPDLDRVEFVLAEREYPRVVGVQVRVQIPARGLPVANVVRGPPDERLRGDRRMAALSTEWVRVQRVAWPTVEQPRLCRVPVDEQVVVAFDRWESTAEVRPGSRPGVV